MLKLLLVLTIFLTPFATGSNKNKDWLRDVNGLRAMVNAQPLKADPFLSYQCTRYARKMARTKRFVHDPNLKNSVGENIAMSTDPSVDPIEIWRNSAGHYRNMVDSDFKKVGLGRAKNGDEWFYVMRLK